MLTDVVILLSPSNRIVSDPVKSSFYSKLWLERARTNTEAYDDAFAVVPTDRVRNLEECTKVGESFTQNREFLE